MVTSSSEGPTTNSNNILRWSLETRQFQTIKLVYKSQSRMENYYHRGQLGTWTEEQIPWFCSKQRSRPCFDCHSTRNLCCNSLHLYRPPASRRRYVLRLKGTKTLQLSARYETVAQSKYYLPSHNYNWTVHRQNKLKKLIQSELLVIKTWHFVIPWNIN